MMANFSVQEVLEMVARDKGMDVDVEEEANEEVTLTKRIKECLKGAGDAGIDIEFFVDTLRVTCIFQNLSLGWNDTQCKCKMAK